MDKNGDTILKKEMDFLANKYRAWLWVWNGRKGEIEYNNKMAIFLKNENVETNLTKTSDIEIIILKYAIPLIAMLLFFDFNLFHPSMLGLSSAIFLFLIANELYKKYNKQASALFLMVLPLFYFIFRYGLPEINRTYEITNIFNYSFQYLVFLYLFKKIILDFLNKGYKNIYKTDKHMFQYIWFNTEENKELKRKNDRYFTYSLIGISILTFLLGGVLLGGKVASNIKAERIMKIEKNELLKQEKNKDFIDKQNRLEEKVKLYNIELNQQYHLNDPTITDYRLIYIFTGQAFIEVDTMNRVVYPGKRATILSHIRDDKFYFYSNNKEYYIEDAKAN